MPLPLPRRPRLPALPTPWPPGAAPAAHRRAGPRRPADAVL